MITNCWNKNLRDVIGETTVENKKSNQKIEADTKKLLLSVIVFKNEQSLLQTSCTRHAFWEECHFKNLPDILSAELQEQLHHILIRLLKVSGTIC